VAKNFDAQKAPPAFEIANQNGRLAVKYDAVFENNGAESKKVITICVTEALDSLLLGKLVKTNSIF
jgi:hypothetical protein